MSELQNILSEVKEGASDQPTDIEAALLGQAQQNQEQAESTHSAYLERCNIADLYYAAQLPGKTMRDSERDSLVIGGNEYVEPVLRNTVKNAKTQLLDSFTQDQSLAVSFRSRDFRRDSNLEAIAEHNINKYFLRDQDGYAKIEDGIHNILNRGGQFTKVYPDIYSEHEKEVVEDWVDVVDYMQTLAEDWTIDLPQKYGTDESGSFEGFHWKKDKQVTLDPQTMQPVEQEVELIKGKIPLIKTVKNLVIENCSPADIWCDTSYNSFDKARYIMHRTYTTVSEAKKRGYDPEKIDRAADTKVDSNTLPELYFSNVNYQEPTAVGRLEKNHSIDPEERPLTLDEHYFHTSLVREDKETRIYQVIVSGNEVLSYKEVKRFPFVFGRMENAPDSFYSPSLFDQAKPFQDALSLAQRIQQHLARMAAWPRWQMVKGSVDKQSFLNNRPGAVIEVAAIDSVKPFENQQLPEQFFATFQALKESANEALIQPVNVGNADGSISQVSTATVSLKLYNDAQKGMALSKTVCRTYIKPLIELSYDITRDENFPMETPDGQPFSGSELPKKGEWIVDINTSNDDMAQALQLTNIINFIGQMSAYNSSIFNDANKLEAARFLLERFDFDPDKFTTDPSQNQDPHAAQEQAQQMFIQSELMNNQLVYSNLNNRKVAAEIWDIETKATERVKEGESGRALKANDPNLLVAQIRKDIENNIRDNAAKDRETAVKNKAVDREFLLGAAKHATDITAPNINGIR